MCRKVIVLSRVSTEGQDLIQQTQEILTQVYRDGFRDNDIIIIENKESGIKLKEEERRGLIELKRYIESDKSIESVYIYELSRLSRRQTVLYSIRDYLIERKIQLVCLKPEFRLLDDNGKMSETSSLIFSLFSTLSESEMRLKKERLMRGRKYNLLNGKSGGGIPPFGYDVDKDKRYIIHPEESKILKRIFNEYINTNHSLRTISIELKEEGFFPNTSPNTLYSELINWTKDERYLGNSTFPQIISQKEFDLCQQSRVRHTLVYTTKTTETFLLKGLLYDVDLRLMMKGTKYRKGDNLLNQYISYDKREIKVTEGHSISSIKIEPIVWIETKKLYKKYVINKNKHIKQIKDVLQTLGKKMDTIKGDIDKIQYQIDNIEERLIYGKISKTRCEVLTSKLILEKEEKERRHIELTNEYLYKQHQIQDNNGGEDIDLDSLSIPEKVEIVNKVLDIISFQRIDRCKSIIKIFNKYNKRIVVYRINTYGQNTWTKIEERLMKPDEKPVIKRGPFIRHNYKGEVCIHGK